MLFSSLHCRCKRGKGREAKTRARREVNFSQSPAIHPRFAIPPSSRLRLVIFLYLNLEIGNH